MRRRTLWYCAGVLLAGSVQAYDRGDVRSLEELPVMDEPHLVSAAAQACSRQVKGTRGALQEFDTLGLVAQQQNAGHIPEWYRDMLRAIVAHDEQGVRMPSRHTRKSGRGGSRKR